MKKTMIQCPACKSTNDVTYPSWRDFGIFLSLDAIESLATALEKDRWNGQMGGLIRKWLNGQAKRAVHCTRCSVLFEFRREDIITVEDTP